MPTLEKTKHATLSDATIHTKDILNLELANTNWNVTHSILIALWEALGLEVLTSCDETATSDALNAKVVSNKQIVDFLIQHCAVFQNRYKNTSK